METLRLREVNSFAQYHPHLSSLGTHTSWSFTPEKPGFSQTHAISKEAQTDLGVTFQRRGGKQGRLGLRLQTREEMTLGRILAGYREAPLRFGCSVSRCVKSFMFSPINAFCTYTSHYNYSAVINKGK